MSKTKRMLVIAVLASLAAVLGAVESMLPVLPAIPGGKLGIANTVAVVVLYMYGAIPALVVNLVRVIVSCMMYGGVSAFMYSFAGALTSTVAMITALKVFKTRITPVGISVIGASVHNTAQIAVAWIIIRSGALVWYLACLLGIAVVSGSVCGWISGVCTDRLKGMIK